MLRIGKDWPMTAAYPAVAAVLAALAAEGADLAVLLPSIRGATGELVSAAASTSRARLPPPAGPSRTRSVT